MYTIRQKLILYFILPIIGIGLFYFSISRYYTQKEFLKTLEQRAINDSALLADHVQDALLVNDRIVLTDIILDEKYANVTVGYITVFNAAGEVIAQSSLDTIPSNIFSDPNDTMPTFGYIPYQRATIFNIDRPILSGLYKIGTIRIGFDFTNVVDTFNYTTYFFAGLGLFFLIGIILFVFKLSNTIARPISELKETVSQFSQGNFAARAHVSTRDEIGDLAHAFNAMANALKASNALLKDQKHALETQVNELEQWRQATIERELKMVALKETIEQHQKKAHEGKPIA